MMGIMKKHLIGSQRGAFIVIFALVLLVLLGFVALGIEGGRWFLVRAELAKGVDAAALEAAKNISNPFVDPLVLAREFGNENFQAGYVGTPAGGVGAVQFSAVRVDSDKISVTGNVNATVVLAQLFGINSVPVSATSMAQKKEVEIMMILDKSGSMDGAAKIGKLRTAATSFVSFFEETQDKDKMGLISFSTAATVDFALGTNYVTGMKSSIGKLCPYDDCDGATITEDAIEQAAGPKGFTDQSGVPGDKRIQQFVVFFSDGMPTALRDKFKYNNADYDGIVYGVGPTGSNNCRTSDIPNMSIPNQLTKPDGIGTHTGVNPTTTGDGKGTSTTACAGGLNTKWYLFEKYPVPGYSAEYCGVPSTIGGALVRSFCQSARQLALDNAKVLKDKGIKIYVIGLGSSTQLDSTYLQSLSSGSDYTYITPDASELESIFNKIAKDIKLRLVM